MIVALIPAHNEELSIRSTVLSLKTQTVVPDRIIVIADNCTDDTIAISRGAGAEVLETVDNTSKKAGALNQGIKHVIGSLTSDDFILTADADSILDSNWIEDAVKKYSPEMGGLSGAYIARNGRGLITLLQRAEYAQERRRISRRGGYVDVLSGTAAFFPASVISELLNLRGFVYDESSLTEDFEITLALKSLGYHPRCFKELRVVTDVMETWGDLYRQRLRWQRGTIETLFRYGWTPVTRRLWLLQGATYGFSFVVGAMICLWTLAITMGLGFSLIWLSILPIFIVEQAVSTKRAGLGPQLVSASLVPMWGYDIFRLFVYWVALGKSVLVTEKTWS